MKSTVKDRMPKLTDYIGNTNLAGDENSCCLSLCLAALQPQEPDSRNNVNELQLDPQTRSFSLSHNGLRSVPARGHVARFTAASDRCDLGVAEAAVRL